MLNNNMLAQRACCSPLMTRRMLTSYLGGRARHGEQAAVRLLVRASIIPPLNQLPEEGVHRMKVDAPLCIHVVRKADADRISTHHALRLDICLD